MPLFPQDPHTPGDELYSRGTITGPASYTQVTPGSPPTGGQVILAKDLGFTGGISHIEFASDGTGGFTAIAIFDGSPLVPVTQVRLLWLVTTTGAQVAGATNLSAKVLRYRAEGRY